MQNLKLQARGSVLVPRDLLERGGPCQLLLNGAAAPFEFEVQPSGCLSGACVNALLALTGRSGVLAGWRAAARQAVVTFDPQALQRERDEAAAAAAERGEEDPELLQRVSLAAVVCGTGCCCSRP